MGRINKRFRINPWDLVTLLYNMRRAVDNPAIGYADANAQLEYYKKFYGVNELKIPRDFLEAFLWSCNMMNELGLFWDVEGREFDAFLKDVLARGDTFNKTYNWIETPSERRKSNNP